MVMQINGMNLEHNVKDENGNLAAGTFRVSIYNSGQISLSKKINQPVWDWLNMSDAKSWTDIKQFLGEFLTNEDEMDELELQLKSEYVKVTGKYLPE